MVYAKKVALPIVFFLAVGFFFLSGPEMSFAQAPTDLGCCINPGNQCVGCDTDCQVTRESCQAPATFTANLTCVDEPGEPAMCDDVPPPATGCCQIEATQCRITGAEGCEIEGGFFPGVTCPDSGLCVPPIPPQVIPTLSQWGIIIMAGFLGLIAIYFVTRRFALRRSS